MAGKLNEIPNYFFFLAIQFINLIFKKISRIVHSESEFIKEWVYSEKNTFSL